MDEYRGDKENWLIEREEGQEKMAFILDQKLDFNSY